MVVAVIWLVGRGGTVGREPVVALELASSRTLEGRVAYAAADHHRRHAVARAGGAPDRDAIALPTLARLEQRGDLHGVAAGYLLLGEPARATVYLERAAASADVAADRALVLLTTGHAAEALVALDGVLVQAPRHPQALWNRALALRDLGLARMAAAAFDAVAALGEPGWADEARERAKALTAQTDERKAPIDRVMAAGPRLASDAAGIPAELARRIPGSTRLFFYDAVRGATTADAVRALAPLARVLDAEAGDAALTSYVDRIARADFRRRGPLAARYASVVAGERLAPRAANDLLAALRAARQDDILLGALILTSPDRRTVPPALVPELRRLAEATGEPWFRMLAVEQEATALAARGEREAAELLVLRARAACTARLDFRCARLDFVLAETYLAMLRLSDARRAIADGIVRTQRGGEWLLEQRFLPQLADLELLGDDVAATTLPLARAYVGELVQRDPRCTTELWGTTELAMMLLNRNDAAGARDELARGDAVAAHCPGAAPTLLGAFVKAHVATDDQVPTVRAEIAALRAAPTTTPGMQAALDQAEGMVMLERDRDIAVSLLARAIGEAREIASSDVDAHKALSYAYSTLTLEAGRAGKWDEVWRLLGNEAGVEIERCAVGVAVEARRSVVVVRDADGALTGSYDGARASELDAAKLIPPALRDRLHGCAEVGVIARPPIQGSPALLPGELAWSYRTAPAERAAEPLHGRRLVIANPEPPAELGLARLQPWRARVIDPTDTVLEGLAATPSHALDALRDASFVEIHAHGVVNAAVSDAAFVILSPDADGRYALTASAIRKQALRGRPVVILGACHAGATASYRHEPWGLPAAFVAAGARAVIASPEVIADADAGALFDAVRARIERGASPAQALHDVRREWLAAHPDAAWPNALMVFQ
jgi:tetratricopeptide (TPR) repeat protein